LPAATSNGKLSAIASFYEFHSRHGTDLHDPLTDRDTLGNFVSAALRNYVSENPSAWGIP
jgi:hypothetical protein